MLRVVLCGELCILANKVTIFHEIIFIEITLVKSLWPENSSTFSARFKVTSNFYNKLAILTDQGLRCRMASSSQRNRMKVKSKWCSSACELRHKVDGDSIDILTNGIANVLAQCGVSNVWLWLQSQSKVICSLANFVGTPISTVFLSRRVTSLQFWLVANKVFDQFIGRKSSTSYCRETRAFSVQFGFFSGGQTVWIKQN